MIGFRAFSRRFGEINWRTVLLELFIVFVGVYGAFLLNSYRESKEEERARIVYYETFLQELTVFSLQLQQVSGTLDSLIRYYETRIEAGEKPELRVIRELDFTSNMFIIRSAFSDRNFGAVGQEYLRNLSAGSNLITQLEKRIDAFQADCHRLFYGRPLEAEEFYYSDGRLKEAWQWYLADLRYIRRLAGQLSYAIEQGAIPETRQLMEDLK